MPNGGTWFKGTVKMQHRCSANCNLAACSLNYDVKYKDGVCEQQLLSEDDSTGYGSNNLWVLLEKK